MISRVLGLVGVLATVGCIKVPEFRGGGDGGPGDGATDTMHDGSGGGLSGASATTVGNNVVATLPGLYEMRFSSEGYHFPYNWGIGTAEPLTQVLASPAGTTCTHERDASVTLLPAYVFTSIATGGAVSTQSDIEIELAGPLVAKVRLEWGANVLSCSADPRGTTTFTFFPDGRISRMDVARMAAQVNGDDCSCAGSGDWRVAGATTFNRGVFMGVQGMAYPPTTDGTGTAITNIACLEGNAFRVAVGWKNTQGARLRSPDASTFAVLGDLITPAQMIGGGHLGDATTTYWTSLTDSCTALRTRVAPHTQDPQISVDDGFVLAFGTAQDGIYGGETAYARGGRQVGSGNVTLGTVNGDVGPFALWLDFGNHASSSEPTITKSPSEPPGTWYGVQRPAGAATQYVFWFPGGLATGETITIQTGG